MNSIYFTKANEVWGEKQNMHIANFEMFTCVLYGFPFLFYAYKTGLFAYKRSQNNKLTNNIDVSKLSKYIIFAQDFSILLFMKFYVEFFYSDQNAQEPRETYSNEIISGKSSKNKTLFWNFRMITWKLLKYLRMKNR